MDNHNVTNLCHDLTKFIKINCARAITVNLGKQGQRLFLFHFILSTSLMIPSSSSSEKSSSISFRIPLKMFYFKNWK